MPERLLLKTPAKINLFLKITGKRSDGYHDIFTVMQMVELWDELIIEPSNALEIICSNNDELSGDGNLIYKAALKLKEYSGVKAGARITLHKVIPVGAGLGGGSSDAAAALSGLNKLWGTGLSDTKLAVIGSGLGSDVPFFLNGPVAIGQGRGDELISLNGPSDFWFLLVNPGIHISTVWAYKQLSIHSFSDNELKIKPEAMSIGPFSEAKIELTKEGESIKIPLPKGIRKEGDNYWLFPFNDFEEVMTRTYPVIGSIKEKMVACGAICSLMSGSGSTVFGIFVERNSAERARMLIQDNGWKSWVVKSLHSPPYS
ncbi:MAG: 4-(cytidine 5'-diphospho)-2-C-methyl-D-erythritol kinase [Nitrospira sp.]|nr:4-(cytidine 5'-diphospho)-2-C-methyl-D-erythritol kinase [Nitrospira sp.]